MVDFKPFSLADAVKGGGNNMQTLMALAQLQRSDANARAAAARHDESMRFQREKFDETKRKNKAAELKANMDATTKRATFMADMVGKVETEEEWKVVRPYVASALSTMMPDGDEPLLPETLVEMKGDVEQIGTSPHELADGSFAMLQRNRITQQYEFIPIANNKKDAAKKLGLTGPFAGKAVPAQVNNIMLTYVGKKNSGEATSLAEDRAYLLARAIFQAERVTTGPNGERIAITPELPAELRWPPLAAAPAGIGAGEKPKIKVLTGERRKSKETAVAEINASLANSDLGIVRKILFSNVGPDGKLTGKSTLNKSAAITGDLGVPWTGGREAGQAIRRVVEIILRARTGAAAPKEEVDNYTEAFSPNWKDNDAGARRKIERLEQFFEGVRAWSAGGQIGDPPPLPVIAPGGGAATADVPDDVYKKFNLKRPGE